MEGGREPRVLIGDFGAVARLGLRSSLLGMGFHVVTDEGGAKELVKRVTESCPDVVVMDLDAPGAVKAARRISAEFPAVRVIACSSNEPNMRVFPPFHRGESYAVGLTPATLSKAIRG
jgi:CheY-like chemotaxis protein